ncbi:hypothetical protein MMC30_002507 [Trapelia coarctata]|nr:hypothetical protein [Trapelia coarctata]
MALYRGWDLDATRMQDAPSDGPDGHRYQESPNLDTLDYPPSISGFTPVNRPTNGQLLPASEDSRLQVPSQANESSAKRKKRGMNQLVTPSTTAKKPRKASQPRQPKKINANGSSHPNISTKFPIIKGPNHSHSSEEVKKDSGDLGFDGTEPERPQAANVGVLLSTKTMDKLASFRYQAEPTGEPQDPYASPPSGQPQVEEPNHNYTGVMQSTAATSPHVLGSTPVAEEASRASGAPIMNADEEFPMFTSHMDGLLVNFGEDSDSSDDSMNLLLSSILSGAVKPDSGGLVSGAHGSDVDTSNHNYANNAIFRAEPDDQNIGHTCIGTCATHGQSAHTEQRREEGDYTYSFVTALTDQNAVPDGELDQSLPDPDVHFEYHKDDIEVGSRRTPLPNSSSLKTCGEQLMDDFEDFFVDEVEEEGSPQIPAVQESFDPPSELQLPFDDNDDDNSQTNEVFDPTLQYSSPPPKTNVNSSKVDGSTFYGPTTMDAFRQLNATSSPTPRLSSPVIAVDDAEDVDTYLSAEEDFLDDDIDPEVLDLTDRASKATRQTLLAPFPDTPTTPKLQWRSPVTYKSILLSSPGPLVHPNSSPAPTRHPPSSVPVVISTPSPIVAPQVNSTPSPAAARHTGSSLTQIGAPQSTPQVAKHLVGFDSNGNALPFVRSPFPTKVLDRSPILGLASSLLLRTCFRIGEVINAATVASHTNLDPLIELYARVTYSQRVGVEQFFQFADLFRGDRPPFLNATYVGWKGVDLWDCDSKYFLGESGKGKIARCVGRLKRDETKKGSWKMVVLSIWEASWDDVGYVKGIVCS